MFINAFVIQWCYAWLPIQKSKNRIPVRAVDFSETISMFPTQLELKLNETQRVAHVSVLYTEHDKEPRKFIDIS